MRRKLFTVTIKDCDVQTFTVGGRGGSGKDTSNTGVRVIHRPSGAVGLSTESRSQLTNKQTAFSRMGRSAAFQNWCRRVASEMATGKTVDQLVEDAMRPENLKIEVRTDKGWQEFKDV